MTGVIVYAVTGNIVEVFRTAFAGQSQTFSSAQYIGRLHLPVGKYKIEHSAIMINRIDLFGEELPVFLCHTQMGLGQIASDGSDIFAIFFPPTLVTLHIIDDALQSLFGCGGSGMAINFDTMILPLLDESPNEIGP